MIARETEAIIRQTVRETVQQLKKEGMLKSADDILYAEMTQRLFDYYREPEKDPTLGEAIRRLSNDEYFDILPRYYSRQCTIEALAGMYGCDPTTIFRNKKRLCRRLCFTVKE